MSRHTTNVQSFDIVDAEPSNTSDSPAPASSTRMSWLRLLAWTAGGLVVGLAGQTAWRELQAPANPPADGFAWQPSAASAPRLLAPTGAAGPARLVQAQPAVLHPAASARQAAALVPTPSGEAPWGPAALEATVLVAGEAHPADRGRLALPAGTRFRVSLRADQSGTVRVLAVNPDGQVSTQPLWTGPILAGQSVQTATLRLTGTRGLETLQILLLDADGAVAGHRQVQIWHV